MTTTLNTDHTPTDELVDHLTERIQQLEHALQTQAAIEQAKGVLHERLGLTVDDAFQLLRYASRNSRRPIHQLAGETVTTKKTPPPIIRAIAKQQQWRAALHRERDEARRERLETLGRQVQAHHQRLKGGRLR